MKKLLRRLLQKPVLRLADKFSSRPDRERVFTALTELHKKIEEGKEKNGLIIPFDAATQKFIVLSDQHKGAKNHADDFAVCAGFSALSMRSDWGSTGSSSGLAFTSRAAVSGFFSSVTDGSITLADKLNEEGPVAESERSLTSVSACGNGTVVVVR